MSNSCNICTEKYNRSSHILVKCYCGFDCCRKCFKEYILSINDDPCCMAPNCDKKYDRIFLSNNLDNKFLTTVYKKHKEEILFIKAQDALQVAQNEIDKERKKEKIMKEIKILYYRIQLLTKFDEEYRLSLRQFKLYTYRCPILINTIVEVKNENDESEIKIVKIPCNNILHKSISSLNCNKCNKNIPNYFYDNTNPNKFLINLINLNNLNDIFETQDKIYSDYKVNKDIDNKLDPVLVSYLFPKLSTFLYRRSISEELHSLRCEIEILNKKCYGIVIETKFLRICPNTLCEGFLNDDLRCQVCSVFACKDCREIKEENHICNEDILKSIALLDVLAKPCPGCNSSIFKKNGCDHMYCTVCKTYFHWRTLKILTGRINNPEYFAELETNNRQRDPNDIICGREIDFMFRKNLREKYLSLHECNDTKINNSRTYMDGLIISYHNTQHKITCLTCIKKRKLEIIIDSISYFRQRVMRRFTNNFINERDYTLYKRYLLNIIDLNAFKSRLQQNDKKDKNNEDMLIILSTFINTMTEILYRLYEDPIEMMDDILEEIDSLVTIINIELKIITKAYNITACRITSECLFDTRFNPNFEQLQIN